MGHAVRLTVIIAALLLASCWRDAPLQPDASTEKEAVNLSPPAQLAASPEELANFLTAVEDAITREVPGLGYQLVARDLDASLRELVTALSTADRSSITHAVRSVGHALDTYRTSAPEIAADLATVDAIHLVLERVGLAALEEGRERQPDTDDHQANQ